MKTWVKALAGLSAIGGGLALYAWGGERSRLRLQRYQLRLPGDVGAGLRILHLSDQHFGGDSWVRRRRLQTMQQWFATLKPDLILLTGDFLHNDSGLDAVEAMLQMLPPARLGCYAVLGNHDYVEYSWSLLFDNTLWALMKANTPREWLHSAKTKTGEIFKLLAQIWRNDRLRFSRVANNTAELRALLELYDVKLLHNCALPLPGRADLWLAGVDDLIEGSPEIERALAGVPDDADLIFLTHNPDLAYSPQTVGVALTLSGHTHGGQVVLPGLGALHTQGTRLPREKPAGHFRDLPGKNQMIVSRGMGESTPLRFGCRPEVVVIDLLPE